MKNQNAAQSAVRVANVTASSHYKMLSQLLGALRTAEISKFGLLSGETSFWGHGIHHSGSALQPFCPIAITFSNETHRFRQQDRILSLWIIFLLHCKTFILMIKIGLRMKCTPLPQSSEPRLKEIFQNKWR